MHCQHTGTWRSLHTHTHTKIPSWMSRDSELICALLQCRQFLYCSPEPLTQITPGPLFLHLRELWQVCSHTGTALQFTAWWREWEKGSEKVETGRKKGEDKKTEKTCNAEEERCLFSVATERHLIFLSRPLDQGDLQRERGREREGEKALRWL